jgi:hypothetical protein
LYRSFFSQKIKQMTKLIILLTGYLLFGQPTFSVAQKDAQLRSCCEKIMRTGPSLIFTAVHSGKMRFRLLGIYSHGPTLFFLLRLNNRSPLDYDIDSIRFSIVGAGPARQVLLSPRALAPIYVYDSMVTVPGYRRETTIYAMQRFTLPSGGRLQIIVREKNGGRHLRLQADNTVLERARII